MLKNFVAYFVLQINSKNINLEMKKHRLKIGFLILLFFVLASSCVEEYWPDINSSNTQMLVVDGKISNFPGPYTIKLSYSSALADTNFLAVTSARVTILDDEGSSEQLKEKSPGIYQTDAQGIKGQIGHAYKTKIILANGKTYESDFETLKKPLEVESVEYDKQWRYAQNELETDEEGYQFYVSSKTSSSFYTYLYWELEETFEYHSNYKIYFFYDGSIPSQGESNFYGIQPMNNFDTLFYCWRTQKIKERYNFSLEHLSTAQVKRQNLHFIPFSDSRLRFGYNLLVKQYSVSERAYTYLNYLREQNENQAGIFSRQAFQFRGNIKNVEDDKEIVLGYFVVAGGSYGPRIQLRAPEGIKYPQTDCFADPDMTSIQNRIANSSAGDWPLYFTYFFFEYADPPQTAFAYISPNCVDCRRHGGVAVKPEFWQ